VSPQGPYILSLVGTLVTMHFVQLSKCAMTTGAKLSKPAITPHPWTEFESPSSSMMTSNNRRLHLLWRNR
jgi:hypothetical protein